MPKQSRRDFFKISAALTAVTAGVTSTKIKAESKDYIPDKAMGVLIDTTVCIGCRKCEWACKVAHDMPTAPLESYDNRTVFNEMRRPDHTALTVINEFPGKELDRFPIDVKYQCMHCNTPACVSACIVKAFHKHPNGTVTWDGSKCIGCRYCMVACPFQIPAFEFDKAIEPDIKKCDFCFERTKIGMLPACVEICPNEVLTYGKREDLINIAHNRIEIDPDKYENHVYGEFEVGGTSWLYLAGKKMPELGMPDLPRATAPGVSESIQHGLFAYFVPPLALYAVLGGVMWINKNRKNSETEE
ncbi:MAG: 4Fe-4S dicluster domain-containing protein [Melioribacteraceae bacterium]|nr:4Fe-4S dicluster domain-containing protein [Melioribacteraceae bacterium]